MSSPPTAPTTTPQPVTLGNINNVAPFDEVALTFSGSGDTVAIAKAGGMKIKVYRLVLVAAGATVIIFKSGSTSLTGAITLNAAGSIVLDNSGVPWFTAATNQDFIINSSNAVQVSGKISYVQS